MMNDSRPPPSTNKNKQGKKRRRSSKKSSSDADCRSSPPNYRSKGDGRRSSSGGKPPIKTNSAVENDSSSVKVRSGDYPYPTDYNDHFETPACAYDDIFPLLEHVLAKKNDRNNKKKKSGKGRESGDGTILYDPYYCTGRAAIHLDGVFQRHGSKRITPSEIRIQHEKRDFYRDIRRNSVPQHDILITNPPYSGNHKERCLEFAVNQLSNRGRPFFLLMPNYVATKEYFRKIILDNDGGSGSTKIQTFYIAPSSNRSYEYEHPEGTGHQASPFASMWFCGLGCGGGKSDVKVVTDSFVQFHSSRASSSAGAPRIATSLQELIRMGGVSGERRKNPRQRKKMRRQAMQRANDAATGGGSEKGGGTKNGKRKSSSHGGQHVGEEGRSHKKRRKSK